MKSYYPIVELGQYIRQVSKRNRSEADLEVFSVTNSEGFTRSTDYFSKEVFSKDVSNYKIVSLGQFAYNPSRINVGSIDYLRHESAVLVSPLYIVFEGSKEIHADYLFRYLKSNWGNAQIRANTEGAVRDSLKFNGLESIKLPLPPFDDQISIASVLCKVECLIAQRKQHIKQLDELLKSVFLQMFGDPVQNEKGWEISNLSTFGAFKNGINFGKGERGESVRCLGVGDFKSKSSFKDIDNLPFIQLDKLPTEDYFIKDGDLLFVRSNGNRELVGRCMAVYPHGEKVTYSGFCIRYRISNPKLQPTYIAHLFRTIAFRHVLFQGGNGANIQNINQQTLANLLIPIPPTRFQNHFTSIVEKVQRITSSYQQSLSDLEALYGGLCQKAFKGELDLSQVHITKTNTEEEKTLAKQLLTNPLELVCDLVLPEFDELLDKVNGPVNQQAILMFWLDKYRKQLNGNSFSIQHFMVAAQTRLAELHPDNDFTLSNIDYENIKAWVFDELSNGRLKQALNITDLDESDKPILGNLIELKAVGQ